MYVLPSRRRIAACLEGAANLNLRHITDEDIDTVETSMMQPMLQNTVFMTKRLTTYQYLDQISQ